MPLHDLQVVLLDIKNGGEEGDHGLVGLAVAGWVGDAQADGCVIHRQDLVGLRIGLDVQREHQCAVFVHVY